MNTKLKSIVLGITAFVVLTGIIAFASAENDNRVCNEVVININNQLNNHFIDVNDVLSLVNDNGRTPCRVYPAQRIQGPGQPHH